MIIIPPLLYSLISEGKIDPIATKVYRIFKVYQFNSNNDLSLGRILSDTELSEKEFRRAFKQLEDYGFITRTKRPGKTSEYNIGEVK
jgi:DNA-binding transcriptional regulator GbsR (MarR family)